MTDFPEAFPRPNPFHCSVPRHLWRHGLALAIYLKIGEVTAGGKRPYHTDTAKMATFFGANKAYVRRSFSILNHAGFLVVEGPVRRGRAAKIRTWISHEEWAKVHLGQCAVVDKNLMPWTADADPLCGQLWSALDGKMRMYESTLKFARSCERPDDEIVAALCANWKAAKQRKARKDYDRVGTKSVFNDTINGLKTR